MSKYLVVEFDTNEIAVVSEKWLVKESGTDSSDDTVLWPPVKTSVKLGLALKQHAEPDNTWVSCRIIRTMYTTDLLQKALRKAKEAEDESDILTDICTDSTPTTSTPKKGNKRKHRPNPRFMDSESEKESEGDYPTPPKKIPETRKVTPQFRASLRPQPKVSLSSQPPKSASPHPQESSMPQPQATPRLQTHESSRPQTPVCTTTQPQESRKPHQVSLGPQPQASRKPHQVSLGPQPQASRKPHQVSLGPQPQASPKSSSSTSSSDQAQNILSGRDVVILRTLEDIKQGQREMMAMISGLVKRLDGCGEKNTDVPDGVYLPISTEEQLNHTEEILNEPGSMKMMVSYFSSIGGSSVKMMTKRIMKEALHNSLAVHYNWTGAKGKMSFGSLKLSSAVLRAVQRNFPQANGHDIEFFIKDWLRNASDRDGGRIRRTKLGHQNVDNQS